MKTILYLGLLILSTSFMSANQIGLKSLDSNSINIGGLKVGDTAKFTIRIINTLDEVREIYSIYQMFPIDVKTKIRYKDSNLYLECPNTNIKIKKGDTVSITCSFVYSEIVEYVNVIKIETNEGANLESLTFKVSAKYWPIENEEVNYCNRIESSYDEFEKETSFNTPYLYGVSLLKYIKNSKTTYYLSLSTIGYTYTTNRTGVVILFNDKTEFRKPSTKIDYDALSSSSGYRYSAFIPLTIAEVKKFSQKKIYKFKLYIYESDTHYEWESLFPEYVNCLINKH